MANTSPLRTSDLLPLFAPADPSRPIAVHHGRIVSLGELQRDVASIAAQLPRSGAMINLCEDRYHFIAAYVAAASVAHTVLLPSSRVEQIVAEVEELHAGAYRFDDESVVQALQTRASGPPPRDLIPSDHVVMIGFTSGSTGAAKAFPKRWGTVHGSNARNGAAMRDALGVDAEATLWTLATVPPQHMYGMELSVLLPLIGGVAIHSGRPLFPADIAAALASLPRPRVLVSTPVHLRVILEAPIEFPEVDLIVSATAPLDQTLATAIERKLRGRLLEMFGSTETCVFSSRRTAHEHEWRLYPGVTLSPQPDGTLVRASYFDGPVLLQDVLELHGADRFTVRGRNTDMIDVAGKRASLSDLTRRLRAIDGVRDAVVIQPEASAPGAIRRVAALVVAPGLSAADVARRLAPSVDPAFMPRPLVIVDALPHNDVGKLPRERVLQMLGL